MTIGYNHSSFRIDNGEHMNFKVGDVARLKSGGPNMTVNRLTAPSGVSCVWFEGTKKEASTFNQSALEKADESDTP
jgi:uncharacterized protein YodC (DUF2158 family)